MLFEQIIYEYMISTKISLDMGVVGAKIHFTGQILALDSDVVKIKICMVSSHGDPRIITGEQSNHLTCCDETKNRAFTSQKVRAKDSPKLSHGVPSQIQIHP